MNKIFLENKKIENNNILQTESLLREKIEEQDKLLKYAINTIMLLGSGGFLIAGISSYLRFNIIPFLDASQIIFFPQGATMCFYGSLGLILSINQFIITFLKVGEGYNEFDKDKGTIKIFRKGFPGKNSDIDINYPLKDIVRCRNCFKKLLLIERNKSKKLINNKK